MWIAIGVVTVGSAGVIAANAPPALNLVLSWWYDPSNLPALHENPRIHYEPGAEMNARKVAAWLPAAMARIEAAQGRAFGGQLTVGVYATDETFARANGMGSAKPRGTTAGTRVHLSPRLWLGQTDDGDPEKILTHELSHAHLGSNGVLPWVIPTWFWEGLAVTLSDGGGAEGISPDDARTAIAAGRTIVVTESRSLLGGDGQPTDRFAPGNVHDYRMIYRQAGMFVCVRVTAPRSPDCWMISTTGGPFQRHSRLALAKARLRRGSAS